MFKRHEFTCPDVVYLQNRRRKINTATIAVNVLGMAAIMVYGWWVEKREDDRYMKPEPPAEDE